MRGASVADQPGHRKLTRVRVAVHEAEENYELANYFMLFYFVFLFIVFGLVTEGGALVP